MLTIYRITSGAIGLATLAGTILFAVDLLGMEPGPSVVLAGYMGIGGILLGAYLLFFAIKGQWYPNDGKKH